MDIFKVQQYVYIYIDSLVCCISIEHLPIQKIMYFLFNQFSVQDDVEETTRLRVNLNIEEGGTLSKRTIFRFYVKLWGYIHISGTFP